MESLGESRTSVECVCESVQNPIQSDIVNDTKINSNHLDEIGVLCVCVRARSCRQMEIIACTNGIPPCSVRLYRKVNANQEIGFLYS